MWGVCRLLVLVRGQLSRKPVHRRRCVRESSFAASSSAASSSSSSQSRSQTPDRARRLRETEPRITRAGARARAAAAAVTSDASSTLNASRTEGASSSGIEEDVLAEPSIMASVAETSVMRGRDGISSHSKSFASRCFFACRRPSTGECVSVYASS